MDLAELISRLAASLETRRIPFLIIGGVAVSTWVQPRLTRDVDVVISIRKRGQARLKEALIEAGAKPTALEMRLLFEKSWVRLETAGPRLDVHLASTRQDRRAMAHAVNVDLAGRNAPVAAVEDLILYKLAAGRPQDEADVEQLLREIKKVDRAYIERWLDEIAEERAVPMRERWTKALKG